MMMPSGAVHVAVSDFVFRCTPDIQNLYLEVEFDAGQRVIGIHGDLIKTNVGNGNDFAAVGLKLHANLDFLIAKSVAGDFLYHFVAFDSIAFFRRYLQVQLGPFGLSFQPLLHSGDEVADTMDIVERVPAIAGVEDVAFIVGERIMNGCHGVLCDLHKKRS